MKISGIIKNLIAGFWKNGFISLCKIVLEHWIISLLIVIIIAYLCSDIETAIYAWFLIGIFAVYSAIKAIIEAFIEIRNYIRTTDNEYKMLILQKIGGKIFDFVLCVVGIFQAIRIFLIYQESQNHHLQRLMLLMMLQEPFQNFLRI